MSLLHSYLYKIVRPVGTMMWLRWGLRYKLFTYLKPIDVEFSVPFYGRTYRGNLNNFIDRVVYFFGAHERQVMEYCGTLITSNDVVLDIGANVGHHSLFYSSKAKDVHAFEPNPAFRPQFEALVRGNDISNVHLHPFGLGDATQELPYYAPTGDNKGIGSFIAGHESTNESVGNMSIVKADDAVASLGLTRVDFIKIDVEGYEETVLRGLQETMRKFKPLIVMEYEHHDFSSEEQFRALTAGYTPYLLRANTSVLGVFNDPTCRRLPFNFAEAYGEVLLVPEE